MISLQENQEDQCDSLQETGENGQDTSSGVRRLCRAILMGSNRLMQIRPHPKLKRVRPKVLAFEVVFNDKIVLIINRKLNKALSEPPQRQRLV